jgi:HEAT repeat protein
MLTALLMIFVLRASPATVLTDRAWFILQEAAADKSVDKRSEVAHAVGLLHKNARAQQMLEKSLVDSNARVRVASAKALGEMGALSSRAKLLRALNDPEVEVVVAAANSLYLLKDPAAYEVYYALLTGERKSSAGLLHSQLKILKDKRSVEKLAFETGIGFVPFGGMGYEAWKRVTKDDASPVRAAAAERLAKDPDPKSGRALASACSDNKSSVRAAAVEAIIQRGDPALLDSVIPLLSDGNDAVRYDAAAAVVRLNARRKFRRPPQNSHGATGSAPSRSHAVLSGAPQ